ncbi:hypothetical protein PHYBOEH_011979 [Phytophthora boehmeriae]|uniref:Uncharacterized protein n=1 Tax=Phytophthora boehmeriae TaxID=109152 RepID=A0A8T1WUU9_9STRA|nr:hypothetical protein PHYBOEH_011979 [Phytophthora boehmeriae]
MDAATSTVIQRNRLVCAPDLVWRVSHAGNQDSLFRARLTGSHFTDNYFEDVKRIHSDWSSCVPTPFLSTFSSKTHAENWGRELLDKGDVSIYPIDTNGLTVFATPTDEFLIWEHIPVENVGERVQVKPVEDDVDTNLYYDEVFCGRSSPTRGMVKSESTGLYYQPDDETGVQEDEDWLGYGEYVMDHN